MAALLFLLFLALTVKEDRTALRAGCAIDSEIVADLPAGAQLIVRYSLAGESAPCYKVAVEREGKALEGYLPAGAIEGLEHFERGRREAAWLQTTQVVNAIRSSATLPSLKSGAGSSGLVDQAVQLIETSQPGKALELLEPAIHKRQDSTLLALAAVAAWRSDDSRRALDFLRDSLSIQPNPEVEGLYRRVERESKADQGTDKIYGVRVLLRYDSVTVPVATAREMVAALDQEFSRISDQLGCSAAERIVAIVQSREAYRKTTDSAEWSGGQYDGRIRVPVAGGQGVDPALRRVFAHESTHACLSMLGQWPAWLQEGLAQKLSGDRLSPGLREKLAGMAQEGKLPRLSNLRQDWSRMDAGHAIIAYALSLAAVELYLENYSQYGLANLVRNPERLADITADLDKRLGL